jgi:hypothetical protein
MRNDGMRPAPELLASQVSHDVRDVVIVGMHDVLRVSHPDKVSAIFA